jgi:hypothetical protein
MIDYSDIRRLIESRIASGFTLLPYQRENTFISPPDSEHIEVTNTDMQSEQAAMGSTSRKITGTLVIEIFTRSGTGTDLARKAATSLCTVLSGEDSIPSVTFTGGAELIPVGHKEGSTLYQHNLTIPYIYQYGN